MNELDKLIDKLISEKGGTRAQYLHLLNSISNHETGGTNSPTQKQVGGGPGRGKYQFETGKNKGAITAAKRLKTYMGRSKMPIPSWLNKATKGNDLDVSTLTGEQQDALFLGNMREHPKADFKKVWDNEQSVTDFWAENHFVGKNSNAKRKGIKNFNDNYEKFSKEQPFPKLTGPKDEDRGDTRRFPEKETPKMFVPTTNQHAYGGYEDPPINISKNIENLREGATNWLKNKELQFSMQLGDGFSKAGLEAGDSDALRHTLAGSYTSKAIQDKTGNIPILSNVLGYIGANYAGLGHEALGYVAKGRHPDITATVEDIVNNLAGAAVGSFYPGTKDDKKQVLKKLIKNGYLPDGYDTKAATLKQNQHALGGNIGDPIKGEPEVKQKDNTNTTQPYVKDIKNFKRGVPSTDPSTHEEGSYGRKKAELFNSPINKTQELYGNEYEYLKNWFGHKEFKKRLTDNITEFDKKHPEPLYTRDMFPDSPADRAGQLQRETLRSLPRSKFFSTYDSWEQDELSNKFADLAGESKDYQSYRENSTAGIYYPGKDVGYVDNIGGDDAMKGTYIHEKTHSTPMDDFYANKGEKSEKFIEAENAIKRRYGDDYTLELKRGAFGTGAIGVKKGNIITDDTYLTKDELDKSVSKSEQSKLDYLDRSEEVYPRLMNLRYFGNIKPGEIVDDKKIEELFKSKDDIFRTYSKKQVKDMLNKYADNSNVNKNQNTAAYGGSMSQALYGDKFNHFGTGGTHEGNPNGGIPLGVGANGKQNTVEQGEASYKFKSGKYIFSDRIKL